MLSLIHAVFEIWVVFLIVLNDFDDYFLEGGLGANIGYRQMKTLRYFWQFFVKEFPFFFIYLGRREEK